MLDVTQRLEIHELAARYGNVMDDREWHRLGTLFTDDAVFSIRIGDVEQSYDGLEAIHQMLLHGRHPVTHHVTNVEVLEEGANVRLRFKVAGPGRNGAVGSADYDDVLRHTADGWRIALHRVVLRSPGPSRRALQRVEAQLAIQQLAVRYAMAVDARDLDLLAEQWSADAWMGKQHGAGPDGVRSFFRPILQRFYRSIHMVVGHRIDLIDEDNATGMVYCRAEHESGDDWVVQAIVYQDTYRCLDGRWGSRVGSTSTGTPPRWTPDPAVRVSRTGQVGTARYLTYRTRGPPGRASGRRQARLRSSLSHGIPARRTEV